MRYHALATDYDGTLAKDGGVDQITIAALKKLKESGRRLLLVTGRQLEDLRHVFPEVDLFDSIVAENGAVTFNPASKKTHIIGEKPPDKFITELTRRNISPLSIGNVIVATWHPNETAVMEVIRDMGLELQIIFNKGAVMVLPPGINKAAGLYYALEELKLSRHNVAGIGDAENDHAFLQICECAAVVSNAVPILKEKADLVTKLDHGKGVCEFIERILESDLEELAGRLQRHNLLIGTLGDKRELRVRSYATNMLVAGSSGGGKTTFATSFLERLKEHQYQFCIFDPEGDYQGLEKTVIFGDVKQGPNPDEIVAVLQDPRQDVVVNLLGVRRQDRPVFFEKLLPRLQQLRTDLGHPHWIIVDETHHLIPDLWNPASAVIPQKIHGFLMITVHPETVSDDALAFVDTVIIIGRAAVKTLETFSKKLGVKPPAIPSKELEPGEALYWKTDETSSAVVFQTILPQKQQRRHTRKYAEGELPPDRSFYFRGPEGKLNLRAQNLMMFLHIAEGIDDETWLYHLCKGDYSTWFEEKIKDPALAQEARQIEANGHLSAAESRAKIAKAVEQRYTAPASSRDQI